MQKAQVRILAVMLLLSMALVVSGLAQAWRSGASHAAVVERAADAAMGLHPAALLSGLREGAAGPLLVAGILVMLATPFVRLGLLICSFVQERDWTYVACCGLVAAVLVVSFALRVGHG